MFIVRVAREMKNKVVFFLLILSSRLFSSSGLFCFCSETEKHPVILFTKNKQTKKTANADKVFCVFPTKLTCVFFFCAWKRAEVAKCVDSASRCVIRKAASPPLVMPQMNSMLMRQHSHVQYLYKHRDTGYLHLF